MQNEERLEENTVDVNEAAEETAEVGTVADSTEAEGSGSEDMTEADDTIDYAALAEKDMAELSAIFPHLKGKRSVAELDNPLRYAALRDLGLTPKEAYLATSEPIRRTDNRSHLTSAVPHAAGEITFAMSARELSAARELFSGLSDREIRKLYNKVTK